MQFEYIDSNLNIIMQNPDMVMYLRADDIGNKRALFAIVREEQGVYRKVQITREESKMTFPSESLYWFFNGPGYFFLKNFICFNNRLAVNIANLDGFKAKDLDTNKIFNVGIFATFSDGSATFVVRERKKRFEKQGGTQPYIDLLRQYKEYQPKHDTYALIESYRTDSDTFVIPKLQEKTEEPPIERKLIPIKKDDKE